MLPLDSTLNNGRFRIVRTSWSADNSSIHEAVDDQAGQTVLIQETSSDVAESYIDKTRSLDHPSLIKFGSGFSESGRKYMVSEPLTGTCVASFSENGGRRLPVDGLMTGLCDLLDALTKVSASVGAPRILGLSASNIRVSPDGELKFQYSSVLDNNRREDLVGNSTRSELSFQPLEQIWTGLDLASQKAISNSYDDGSLEVLESPPDHSSDLFVLGAIVYFLVTGQKPLDALERSIEVLDGKQDPLVAPALLNGSVGSEFSDLILKMMRLRREDRFESFAIAARRLRVVIDEQISATSGSTVDDLDDLDLLEIPELSADQRKVSNLPVNAGSLNRRAPVQNVTIQDDFVAGGEPRIEPVGFQTKLQDRVPELRAPQNEDRTPCADKFSEQTVSGEPDLMKTRSWFRSPAVIVAAAVVVLAAASWGVVNFATSAKTDQGSRNEAKTSTTAEPPTPIGSLDTHPLVETPSSAVVEPTSAPDRRVEKSADPGSPPTKPVVTKERPAVADVKKDKKSDAPQTDAGTKPKKKVTVDDLINDN